MTKGSLSLDRVINQQIIKWLVRESLQFKSQNFRIGTDTDIYRNMEGDYIKTLGLSLRNTEDSVKPMVDRAILSGKFHGIDLHRGVANLVNGDCAFETTIDSVNTRSCFQENYEGTPAYWRRMWMTEIENIAYSDFNSGLTKEQWKDGWSKLKESGTYEYSLGDLVLPGIAHCMKKDILIFNTSPVAHCPLYVVSASTFGSSANTEIPICLAYDQVHYESLTPDSLQDITKTIELKNSVLQGTYTLRMKDIPIFADQSVLENSSYASVVKLGNQSANNSSVVMGEKMSRMKASGQTRSSVVTEEKINNKC